MPFPWWSASPQRKSKKTARTRRPAREGREPRLELLESRDLLSGATPDYVLLPAAGAAPFGTSGPTGYTPSQIRHAYGFDQITFNGVAGDGSGTTIAIVDAYDDPNIASDLHQFDLKFGLPDPTFTKVNQSGGTTMPRADAGWASEIALDVEWAHAIAPGASILLVEASDSSYANLFTAVDYAASQPGVVAVSMSWGGGESPYETSWDSHFVTPAGHAGVVFIASSGDQGAPASYPAASPNVLAVGGTTLSRLDAQGDYTSETGWSGSGGGLSAYEGQPSYQKGVVTQSSTARANPDVAYDADPNTGFPVYDSYNNGSATPWSQFGGTSDAAPQWAALVAIADQGRALAGKSALGGPTLLADLYQLPASDFHDVTSGTSTGSPYESAGTGYDLVTGLGSPYADRVVADLVGPSASPSVTHFQVTVSAPSTAAGSAFSVTVTALDASNNAVSGYAGKVHFTSSDPAASLPADYTFTADSGTHTFTGVVLLTAGSQTVTVADAANPSANGSASITITPSAAGSFRVSGYPSAVTAGASASFTVTAVDAYGNPVSGYAGTVHFTSSDPSALLPADATLAGGTGTFSATFTKAGSQSLTATDTADSAMTGTESGITVNPAAATHLAFGQQPTNATAGSAITPAVTVQLLDAYNNVVTTDNTDQVSLSLAANPSGGTLSGSGPVTVVHGVATFKNLSVDRAGTGYALAATSGTLAGATSNSFSVTAATSTVIENFNGGLGQYWLVGANYPSFTTATYAAHDGTYGLDNGGNGDWIFRDDSAAQVRQGDTVSVWVKLSGAADGRAYFGFGSSSAGTLSLVVAPNTNQLLIQSNAGFGFSNLAAVSQSYLANHWYRLEVAWGTSGAIVGRLYDSDGKTLLKSVTASTTAITSGGIAFRATGHDKYWDTVTVTRGVNPFRAAPPAGTDAASSFNAWLQGALAGPEAGARTFPPSAAPRYSPAGPAHVADADLFFALAQRRADSLRPAHAGHRDAGGAAGLAKEWLGWPDGGESA
jgi:hypothetical protein